MKKVRCVRGAKVGDLVSILSLVGGLATTKDRIQEGKIYTVMEEITYNGIRAYRLRGNRKNWYAKNRFVDLESQPV